MRIGFIGIGVMGSPMAATLVKKGFEVTVYDAVPERVASFAQEHGCRGAGKLLDLADSEAVVTMLPTGPIVRQVLLEGEGGGLGRALKPGSVVIDMSSSEPVGTQQLGAELAKYGVTLIDCCVSVGKPRASGDEPVQPGPAAALAGALTLMIGTNDRAALERVRPVLSALGERLFECGPLGSGNMTKSLNNYLSAAGFCATVEALLIAERLGLNLNTMVDAFNVSTGRNFTTDVVAKEHLVSKKCGTGFTIGLFAKDIKIAAGLSEAADLDAPVLRLVCDRFLSARDQMGADRDHTETIVLWNKKLSRKAKEAKGNKRGKQSTGVGGKKDSV